MQPVSRKSISRKSLAIKGNIRLSNKMFPNLPVHEVMESDGDNNVIKEYADIPISLNSRFNNHVNEDRFSYGKGTDRKPLHTRMPSRAASQFMSP